MRGEQPDQGRQTGDPGSQRCWRGVVWWPTWAFCSKVRVPYRTSLDDPAPWARARKAADTLTAHLAGELVGEDFGCAGFDSVENLADDIRGSDLGLSAKEAMSVSMRHTEFLGGPADIAAQKREQTFERLRCAELCGESGVGRAGDADRQTVGLEHAQRLRQVLATHGVDDEVITGQDLGEVLGGVVDP